MINENNKTMKTTQNLVTRVIENIAPFMLADAGIDAIFVTDQIREEYAKKINVKLEREGMFENINYQLISISVENRIIGGVLFYGQDRENLDLTNYNGTLQELNQ